MEWLDKLHVSSVQQDQNASIQHRHQSHAEQENIVLLVM